MSRRRDLVALTIGIALLGSAVAGAQERLPGVVTPGKYDAGTLPTPAQPAPAPAPGGPVFGVGGWPTYTSPLADGPGRDQVLGSCSTCHSTTYITMQPPLPAKTWEAEVTKMIKTFGANIPDDTASAIVRYLQSHYTPETRREGGPAR